MSAVKEHVTRVDNTPNAILQEVFSKVKVKRG